MTDLDRIRNYLREKMGVDTTAEEMSISTAAGIVHFGMIGYAKNDSFIVVVSPDNPVLMESSVDGIMERIDLVKKYFPLFTPDCIHGIVVCERTSRQALDYAAKCPSMSVLEINEESITEVSSLLPPKFP